MLKLVYVVLGVALLIIGLIGLLFPVIPGILFIALAVFLISKASTRLRSVADGQPFLRRMNARFDAMGDVSIGDRCRLAGLMCLEAVAVGLKSLADGISRLERRFTS